MVWRMVLVVTLLILGVVLVVLETVLPGMVAGLLGGVCLLAGVVLAYQQYGASMGHIVLLATVALLLAMAVVWFKYFPRSSVGRIMVSRSTVGQLGTEMPELLQQTGTSLTVLRPSGTALIADRRVDVVTEGAHVGPGTAVRVVAVEGMRVVVRPM